MERQKEQRLNRRNKMTEKDYNPEQRNAKAMKKQETATTKVSVANAPKKEDKKTELKETKEKVVKKIVKKDEAVVNNSGVPVSTKDAMAICRFIKRKPIEKAIADLKEVLVFKRAIPMKGEIPHRKGKIMAGRYPINAVKEFLIILKTLSANANVNGLAEPIIAEAIPNKAPRPRGRFGAVERKRTHIKIIAREKKGGKK